MHSKTEAQCWVNRIRDRLYLRQTSDIIRLYQSLFTNRIQRVPMVLLVDIFSLVGIQLFDMARVCKGFHWVTKQQLAWIHCLNDIRVSKIANVSDSLSLFWQQPPRPGWPLLRFHPPLLEGYQHVNLCDKKYFSYVSTNWGDDRLEDHIHATTLVQSSGSHKAPRELEPTFRVCALRHLYIASWTDLKSFVPMFTCLQTIEIVYSPNLAQRQTIQDMRLLVFPYCTILSITSQDVGDDDDKLYKYWLPNDNWPKLEAFKTHGDIWVGNEPPFTATRHPTLTSLELEWRDDVVPFASPLASHVICSEAQSCITRLRGADLPLRDMNKLRSLHCGDTAMTRNLIQAPHVARRLHTLRVYKAFFVQSDLKRILEQGNLSCLTSLMFATHEMTFRKRTCLATTVACGCPILQCFEWYQVDRDVCKIHIVYPFRQLTSLRLVGATLTNDTFCNLPYLCPNLVRYQDEIRIFNPQTTLLDAY